MSSAAQLAANRANSQKSTGPSTEEGKDRVRFNAVRHNLTGASILLPSDDAALYEQHCRSFHDDLKPLGHREELLVQAIADHHWRLARIPSLEAAIYAAARMRFAEEDQDRPAALIDAQIYMTCEKQFRNLQIQEARLTRYVKNDMAELKSLQAAREREEKEQFELAATLAAKAEAEGQTFYPEEFGFVFSTADLAAFTQAKGDLKLAKRLMKVNRGRVLTQAA